MTTQQQQRRESVGYVRFLSFAHLNVGGEVDHHFLPDAN